MGKQSIPSWPKERDLSRYAEYTTIDFEKELGNSKTWIDIGCRTGKALSQTRKLFNAKLIGVNSHKIKVRAGIIPIYASLPEDLSIYKKFKHKAQLVTDIYGAVTYGENPIESLIYEATLLQKNAKAVIVTLEDRMGSPNSAVWKRISYFFDVIMGQSISFKRFGTYSDNTKTPIKSLRIIITGKYQSQLQLNDLFSAAMERIGIMKKAKIIAEPPDKSFAIWRVHYLSRGGIHDYKR